MKVLIAHVQYRQAGGEDEVVSTEASLLRSAGVDTVVHSPRSAEFDTLSSSDKCRLGMRFANHQYGRALVRALIVQHRPDVVHFHNIYPLFGPGGMAEAARMGCGVVQTLHNYRLSCLNGRHFLFGEGELCTRCRPGHFGPGVSRACYRDSRLQSTLMAWGLTAQWRQLVHDGIPHVSFAVSDFLAERLIAQGVPAGRIMVKANSVADGMPDPSAMRRGAVYVGRLSEEKGVLELLRHWPDDGLPLAVVGDGPLADDVRATVSGAVRVEGPQPSNAVRRFIREASVCAVPSLVFEGLPLVLQEAFAEGTPVVAFDGTAAGRAVRDVDPSLAVRYGDMPALVARCAQVASRFDWHDLSLACRRAHARCYAHEQNLDALLVGYSRAIRMASASGVA